MPTYEYKCKKCGCTFEKFQSIKDSPVTHCKYCEGNVYRLISKNVSFILKGSGFYSTDNPKTSHKSGKKKASKSLKNKTTKNGTTKKSESKGKEKKSLQPSVK